MKISIIVPVYNVSAYIERCLSSVAAQTYSDIECIIVNDCTPDDSMDKVCSFLASYNGPIDFKIYNHTKNKGLSASRNTGTELASGEYIFYLDSDDEILPECISLLGAEIEKHPGVEMVVGAVESVPYNPYYDLLLYKSPVFLRGNSIVRFYCHRNVDEFPVNAWNKLILKKLIINNGLFFKDGLIHEDQLWMFMTSKVLSKVAIISQKTYIHYSTPKSIMGSMTEMTSAMNWQAILFDVIENVDGELMDLMAIKYLNKYLSIFNLRKGDKSFVQLGKDFAIKLVSFGMYKLAIGVLLYVILFPLHKGHYLWRVKDRWVPKMWQKLTCNYSV